MSSELSDLLSALEDSHDRGDWITARELAEQIISIDPESTEARVYLRIASRKIDENQSIDERDTERKSNHSEDTAKIEGPQDLEVEHSTERTAGLFVGRKRENERLIAAFEEVVAGHGRLVMLAGEPGIGKTRIAEKLAAHAESRGARVLWGRLHEGSGAPPYWPWVQIIRTFVDGGDWQKGQSDLDRYIRVIARVVPELAEEIGEKTETHALGDQESERFRFYDSTTRFLKTASLDEPIVIVLDDLHWSDEPSLKLLEFFSHEIAESHILVVGTYRDMELRRTHPLSKTLGDIGRERQFERITLRGLSKADLSQMIEYAAGAIPTHSFVEKIHLHTEGNPLFAREIIRYLAQEGRLSPEQVSEMGQFDLRIPEGVREVIGRRLDTLSTSCNSMLRVAAVTGREFSLELLLLLVKNDLDEQAIAVSAGEALKIGVIEELPGAIDRYRFVHKLIQDTLTEELTMTERLRLHARIAETLEELYGDNVDEHAAEIAAHLAEAQILVGTEKLVRYSQIAGERAFDRNANEDALSIYHRAIDAIEGQPLDDMSAELYSGFALAQYVAWRIDDAVDTTVQLFEYYDASERVADLFRVTWWLQHFAHFQSGSVEIRVVELFRRAMAVYDRNPIDDVPSILRLSEMHYFLNGDYREAEKILDRALSIAEQQKKSSLIRLTHQNIAFFCVSTGRAYSSVKHFDMALQTISEEENSFIIYVLYAFAMVADQFTGNPDDAIRHIDLSETIAEAMGVPRHMAAVHQHRQRRASETGKWDVSRAEFDRGMEILNRWGYTSPETFWLLAEASLVEYETGYSERGYELINRLLEYFEDSKSSRFTNSVVCQELIIPKIARLTGENRWFGLARKASEAVQLTEPWGRKRAGNLGLIAALEEDSDAAERWYVELLSRKGEIGGYLGQTLGIIAYAAGRRDDALFHFNEGYVFTRDAGYHPNHAWICREWANALLSGGDEKDNERAKLLLDEGSGMADRLGMKPLSRSIDDLRASFATKIRATYPDGLTEREVQLLVLVSRGMTNQEIGYELSISVKTVATHLRHIFDKTNSSNRAEATAYAFRNGLAGDQL